MNTFDLIVMRDVQARQSDVLDEWTWLVGKGMRPIVVTACGDVFIEHSIDATIYFLDTSRAEVSEVCRSMDILEAMLTDLIFIARYLHPERIDMLRRAGLKLSEHQVYSFRKPLSLGGEIILENIDITDINVHFSVAGQVERQLVVVSDGVRVDSVNVMREVGRVPWWKFW